MIRKVEFDVLKPSKLSLPELGEEIASLPDIDQVGVRVKEVDPEVEKVALTAKGENVNYKRLKKTVKKLGASVHSVDSIEVASE